MEWYGRASGRRVGGRRQDARLKAGERQSAWYATRLGSRGEHTDGRKRKVKRDDGKRKRKREGGRKEEGASRGIRKNDGAPTESYVSTYGKGYRGREREREKEQG